MFKLVLPIILLVSYAQTLAQPSTSALEGDHKLQDRYYLLKTKSQTFKDYKVIKEVVLDGFWKITMDSVKKGRAELGEARSRIGQLEGELSAAQLKVKQTNEVLASSEYERTHISVFGMLVGKGVFFSSAVVIIGLLTTLLVTSLGSVRILRKSNKEKDLTNFGISAEFDEFRKKSLEREIKLSRELQNERNKLQAMMKT